MNELLKNLTEAVGVSGEEKEVRLLIRNLIADHVDDWHVDAMGNLIALKKGTGAVGSRQRSKPPNTVPEQLAYPAVIWRTNEPID